MTSERSKELQLVSKARNNNKNTWMYQRRKQLLFLALGLALASQTPSFGQEMIWHSFHESGIKFYERHEYEKAERSLLNAVKEAEKLGKNSNELVASLKELRKVYLAQDKQSQADAIGERLSGLEPTETANTSGDNAGEIPKNEEHATESIVATRPSVTTSSRPYTQRQTPRAGGKDSLLDITQKDVNESSTSHTQTPEAQPPRSTYTAPTSRSSEKLPPTIASSQGIAGEQRTAEKQGKSYEIRKLIGHINWARSLAISSDSTKALSGSDDRTVRLWDLETGQELKRFEGHEDNVNCAVYSPAGNLALSASGDKTLRIWDIESGACLKKLTGHNNIVLAAAFSPSGNRCASGGYDSTVRIWDTLTGNQLQIFEGPLGIVRCLAFTPDGDYVLSAGSDRLITLWRLRDGTAVRRFSGHRGDITTLAVSRDGSKIMSASRDLTIRIWDLATGGELHQLVGHGDWVSGAAFICDDTKIASGSLDKTFRIWDVETGAQLKEYMLYAVGMWSVAFMQDGDKALTASNDYSLRLWRLGAPAQVSAAPIPQERQNLSTKFPFLNKLAKHLKRTRNI
jgi:hypothetical protein